MNGTSGLLLGESLREHRKLQEGRGRFQQPTASGRGIPMLLVDIVSCAMPACDPCSTDRPAEWMRYFLLQHAVWEKSGRPFRQNLTFFIWIVRDLNCPSGWFNFLFFHRDICYQNCLAVFSVRVFMVTKLEAPLNKYTQTKIQELLARQAQVETSSWCLTVTDLASSVLRRCYSREALVENVSCVMPTCDPCSADRPADWMRYFLLQQAVWEPRFQDRPGSATSDPNSYPH